jgi:hypothetical protein
MKGPRGELRQVVTNLWNCSVSLRKRILVCMGMAPSSHPLDHQPLHAGHHHHLLLPDEGLWVNQQHCHHHPLLQGQVYLSLQYHLLLCVLPINSIIHNPMSIANIPHLTFPSLMGQSIVTPSGVELAGI